MAIQNRRGDFKDFDPYKMVPGEFAIITSGDPNSKDGTSVYHCFAPGVVKRLTSYEDLKEQVDSSVGEIIDERIEEALKDLDISGGGATEEQIGQIKTNKQNIENLQQAVDNIKIPSKTSELNNDSDFITKSVNDLANYYLKNQTYSRTEIDNKLSAIPKFSIEVVSSLPTSNISTTTVYLVSTGSETNNLYTEYIYVNNKWEYLGKQTVDLTGYVQKTELSSYYTKTEMESLLTTIRNSIPTKISQLADDSTHRTVTDTEKQTWNNKANTATTLAGYGITDGATKEQFNQVQQEKVDQNKVAIYFTPEMYGAKGNGSNDDSTAIQTAIDNAGSTGIVYLAKKTYKISKPIEITHSNYTFICDGTLSYSGTDSAVIIGSKFIDVDIHCIDAPNGTALKIFGTNKYIEYCKININKITSSRVGLHIYTDSESITYNQIRIGFISATETGIFVECLATYINENHYYLGKITGCNTAIRLHSSTTLASDDGFGTNDNYFYSGALEGITTCAISIENSSGNKFNNLRCQENYGEKILVMTGFCKNNDIRLSRIFTKKIDITGLTGGGHNILQSTLIGDVLGGFALGTKARIDYQYGITYNPINANYDITVEPSTFTNNVIKQSNTLIPTSLYFTDTTLNGKTFSLSSIYSDFLSMARGFSLCLVFSETGGRILLQDSKGYKIIDNKNGEYAGKTLSVKWNGYDKANAVNIWDVQVLGGATPTEGVTQIEMESYINKTFLGGAW